MLEKHFDQGEVKSWDKMKSGALRIIGTVARTGDLKYLNQDGSIRDEYVSPKVLFNEDSLRSLQGVPLTLNHPPEFVTPENFSKYAVGFVSSQLIPREDEGLLDALITVHRRDAIDAVFPLQI